MSFFNAKFVNYKNEEKEFTWRLVDKPYAQRWMTLMLEYKKNWIEGRPDWNDKWFVAKTQADFEALIQEISGLVKQVDELGCYKIGSEKINNDITRDELNRIHQAFHMYVEREVKNFSDSKETKTELLCHKLNDMVHLTESAFNNRFIDKPTLCVVATARQHMHVPYEEEDYLSYTPSRVAGWLYIGYATPGKSLFQCFTDNDMSVVKNKLVRPSQGLSNEIHFELTGFSDFDPNFDREITEKFYNWCKENNVQEYGYDYIKPIHRPGRIPLAAPVDSVSELIEFIGGRQGKIVDISFQ